MKMTMTLELSKELEERLREVAARENTSPENVLVSLADKYLGREDAEDAARQSKIKAAGDYVQAKNAALYERLA
jgi:predicted transcriptional regulator